MIAQSRLRLLSDTTANSHFRRRAGILSQLEQPIRIAAGSSNLRLTTDDADGFVRANNHLDANYTSLT